MKNNLSLYLVTDPQLCGERGVVATVEAAVRGGVTAVQLRDKGAPARELVQVATALLDLLKKTGIPLLINDRLDVALAVGADGVHLGQLDLDVRAARNLAGADFLIGLTVSRSEEIAAVHALPVGTVDYFGIGPVFVTSTKANALDPLGLDAVAQLRRSTDVPCIGIGGITLKNASSAWSTGLDGLAVVSAICASDDPRSAAEAFRNSRP
ncbi:MAG TPA: thiamine phosphate synthase [Candidatus Paceibacterota bacterium]|nr:thiamine phosphate synthase [Candidatus Paceibacterota bacterium]